MVFGQFPDHRHQGPADGCGKTGDAQGYRRLGCGIEVQPCRVNRSQDPLGMAGEPASLRCQAYAPALRLGQPDSGVRPSCAICWETDDVVVPSTSATARIDPMGESP
ncbi:hypothetical protein GCM10023166_27590 [Paeniglutamicibacter cryotolerans]